MTALGNPNRTSTLRLISLVAVFLIGVVALASAQSEPQPKGGNGRDKSGRGRGGAPTVADGKKTYSSGGHGETFFRTEVPARPVDFVLGRPTKTSITLSVLTHQEMEGFVAYGTEMGNYTSETPRQVFKKGEPVEILIGSLKPDTGYFYQFRSRAPGAAQFSNGEEKTFHTARSTGSSFTFVVQADPHLDENTVTERYHRSMLNMVSDRPDFLVDLGDTFMTGKYGNDRAEAEKQYLAQRYYFGIIGQSAPVFLVLGNHDGESGGKGRRSDSGGLTPSVWANQTRKKYFPNPVPNDFYTGNKTPHPQAGLLQDYCAWEWGDALFVTLDPFWFGAGGRESWGTSLGREQYNWLKQTLEGSRAKFKFVFIHHLLGGAKGSRGGAETSHYFEWGGKDLDGSNAFAQKRPGWPAPIHELLVKNGVSIVFHGHDHLFAKQDRDGIVYQCVPQPGGRGNGIAPQKDVVEYGYASGKILGSPGYMRITVTPEKVTADLVRSYVPTEETAERKNRQVDFSYSINAAKNAPAAKGNAR